MQMARLLELSGKHCHLLYLCPAPLVRLTELQEALERQKRSREAREDASMASAKVHTAGSALAV